MPGVESAPRKTGKPTKPSLPTVAISINSPASSPTVRARRVHYRTQQLYVPVQIPKHGAARTGAGGTDVVSHGNGQDGINRPPAHRRPGFDLVAIAASWGGPAALVTL